MKTSLNKLPINHIGIIQEIQTNKFVKRRLLDLGMIKDTKIKALYKSPLGDPTAYLIRGSVIALRSKDTKNISIIFDGDLNGTY